MLLLVLACLPHLAAHHEWQQQPPIPFSVYVLEAWTYVHQSVTHSLMRKCPEKGRWLGHWLLALGTVMMLTIKVFALRWFQTDNIYPLYNPQRWLGYLAAGLILYGIGDIFLGRVRAQKEIYKETRSEDLVFPILLVLTGSAVWRHTHFPLCRLSRSPAHYAYALHIIIATPMLLVEMAFGKWAHMIYRPLALYFLAVRERAARLAPAAEAFPMPSE